MAKMEFSSISDPRNRGKLMKIGSVVFICLLAFYFIFGRSSTPLDRYSSGHTNIHDTPNPPKPIKKLTNPYNHVNVNEPERQSTRTLVIAKMAKEDTNWIDNDLSDILQPKGDLTAAIYVANDKTAPLHPPVNKGHEAMIYLTYIIDHYDHLPDVAIFMHFHGATWHNNDLLGTSSSKIVRALSSEKILRDGYMNLRCHWEPGCPSWIHPQTDHFDDHKKEEQEISRAFTQLYPNDTLPVTLAQPCCGQFAVSGERIRQLPRERYIELRRWIERTDLDDTMSGRVFEYTWQYLFTSDPVHCRNMHLCYCDGYSICFESEHSYIQYLDIQDTYRAFRDDLEAWKEQDEAHRKGEGEAAEKGRGEFLERNIEDLLKELGRRKQVAMDLGENRQKKYEILRRAWDELTEHPPGHLAEKYGHFGVDSDII